MARARDELLQCDELLIDISDKPGGGRILEAGIAFGHNKPVIVLAKRGTKISTPMAGIAAAIIEYDNVEGIQEPLRKFVQAKSAGLIPALVPLRVNDDC